ncbi:hypothetical protein BB561_006167 [Smittium simulii]|uniref:Tryptophan synthase beta chain-like PALP domain-containing protein n=1 Tax=Smittium simulii TaxID=133385 RepID=A0A2T9Y652_9FUNG|nr:hypothetical protein BB561_006167 [Smittium simulii]
MSYNHTPLTSSPQPPPKLKLAHLRKNIYRATPIQFSEALSQAAGCQVWLKLENMHPTHTYKLRAITEACLEAVYLNNAKQLVCVGLNNLSLSIAYVGKRLAVPVVVFLPCLKASPAINNKPILRKFHLQNATLVEYGTSFSDSEKAAVNFSAQSKVSMYISKSIVESKSVSYLSLIAECKDQLSSLNISPNAVLMSVCSESDIYNSCLSKASGAALNSKSNSSLSSHLPFQPESSSSISSKNLNSTSIKTFDERSCIDSQITPNNISPLESDSDLSLLDGILTAIDLFNWDQLPIIAVETFLNSKLHKLIQSPDNSNSSILVKSHCVIPISVTEQLSSQSAAQFAEDHQLIIDTSSAAPLTLLYNNIIKEILPELNSSTVVLAIINSCSPESFSGILSKCNTSITSVPIMVRSGEQFFIRMENNINKLNSTNSILNSLTFNSHSSDLSKKIIKPRKSSTSLSIHKKSFNPIPENSSKSKARLQSDPGITPLNCFQNVINFTNPSSKSASNHLLLSTQPCLISKRSASNIITSYTRPPPGPAASSNYSLNSSHLQQKRIVNRSNSSNVLQISGNAPKSSSVLRSSSNIVSNSISNLASPVNTNKIMHQSKSEFKTNSSNISDNNFKSCKKYLNSPNLHQTISTCSNINNIDLFSNNSLIANQLNLVDLQNSTDFNNHLATNISENNNPNLYYFSDPVFLNNNPERDLSDLIHLNFTPNNLNNFPYLNNDKVFANNNTISDNNKNMASEFVNNLNSEYDTTSNEALMLMLSNTN